MRDLTGKRYGRLVVIKRAGTFRDGHITWLCRCDCGNEKIVNGNYLRRGETQSCGCLNKEINRAKATTHGMKGSRLYSIWQGIKRRTINEEAPNYRNYGGRGIEVCPEWRDSFESFRDWALKAGYDENAPRGRCTIERKDVNGPYSPENCCWATFKEQQNNRRNNKAITYNGETHTIAQWAEKTGISYSTLRARLKKWPVEKSLTTPTPKARRNEIK